jgi:hypothetical protein
LHPLFRTGDPLPAPPGQSPFHIRGIYYDRLFSRMKRIPGGVRSVLEALDDPRIVDFAGQRFSWMGWYDVLPAVPITEAFARALKLDFELGVREETKRGALGVVPSAFRPILALPGPAAFAAQSERITATVVDFVRLRIHESTETHSSGWTYGVPLYVAPLIANTTVGFFAAIVQMRGGTDVRARYTDVVREGERDGFETVSIRYGFDWTQHHRR